MARQRGGLDPSDTSAIIGLVIFFLVAGLAIGLGVYFGTKKNDKSSGPAPPPVISGWSNDQGGASGFCATSIYVSDSQLQNGSTSSPTLKVNYEISPKNVSGTVSAKYTGDSKVTGTVTSSPVDATIGTLTINFEGALPTGWHNGTVELAYVGTNNCTLTQSSPVQFFA
jgi:hypothetical protein